MRGWDSNPRDPAKGPTVLKTKVRKFRGSARTLEKVQVNGGFLKVVDSPVVTEPDRHFPLLMAPEWYGALTLR